MKIFISKNKNKDGYYMTIKNKDISGKEIKAFMPVNLPKGSDLGADYGVFDCNFFFSCYESNGKVYPKIVVKSFNEEKEEQRYNPKDFEEFGEQVTIDNDFLD